MGFIDFVAGGTKSAFKIVLAFAVISVVGGILAGVGDVFAASMLAGTPFEPGSELAPLAWTLLAGLTLYGLYWWSER